MFPEGRCADRLSKIRTEKRPPDLSVWMNGQEVMTAGGGITKPGGN